MLLRSVRWRNGSATFCPASNGETVSPRSFRSKPAATNAVGRSQAQPELKGVKVNKKHAKSRLSQALGLALLGMAGPQVLAQSATDEAEAKQRADDEKRTEEVADAEELETVVVSGYRRSLQFSTEAKREAIGFTDSIFAEDIGKFPDLNIAESLNRIPGVQLDRDVNGEGLNIGIRGLPQSFTKTLINGGEAVTASIGLNRGNQNREVDLNLFPTEFFNKLTVYKSPQASLPEGGIAGTVDMRSARPFDNPGQNTTYSLQADYNDSSDKLSPRGSVIHSWTNDDDTFGVLIGGSTVRSHIGLNGFETIGWMNPALNYTQCGLTPPSGVDPLNTRPAACNTGGGGSLQMPNFLPSDTNIAIDRDFLLANNPGLTIEQFSEALFPRLGRPVDMSGERNRDSFLGSVEWKPNEDMNFYVDMMYSAAEFTNNRIDVNLVGRTFGPVGFIPTNTQIDSNNVVTSSTLLNAQFFLEARPYHDEVQYWNINPGATFWFGEDDGIKLDVQGTWSRSWFFRESPTILVNSPRTTVEYTNDGGDISYSTGGLDLNDPNLGWTFTGGRVNLNNEKRVTEAGRLRADLQFGDDANNFKTGFAYDDFRRTITAFDNSAAWQAYVFANVDSASLASFLRPGPGGFITADFDAFFDATNYQQFFDSAPEANTSQSVGAASGGVDEQNLAVYVEANGVTEVWNRELRFNAGVRRIDTDQEISGPVTLGGVRQIQTLDGSYNEWLPSFGLAWTVADDVVLRLASSRTLTRPNPRSMLPATTFSDPSAEIADQGNPDLSPYTSVNVDLGLEWYTGEEGLVAMSVFNKRVRGYTFQGVNVRPFRDLGIPFDTLSAGQQAALNARGGLDAPVNVRQQVNADAEVDIKGWEAIWVQPLDRLVDGFGFMATYTDIELEAIGQDASQLAGNLFGIAPVLWNTTLYWEGKTTAVRLSYNFTEGFPQRAVGNNEGSLNYAQYFGKDRGQLDLSASYTMEWLPSKPQLTFNVINVTDEPLENFLQFENVPGEIYNPGRTYLIGIRGQF
jgi:TonB-dependent receptor